MHLPAILVSDLHLTAKPEDKYKWGLFPWLAKQLKAERAESLVILGDVTDAKDYHSSELVNLVVRAIDMLRQHVPHIIILMGNHDLLKTGNMFFQFLDALPGVQVIAKPTEVNEGGSTAFFLPHTRHPELDWADFDLSHYELVFMHQTIKGAFASNGQAMEGESVPDAIKGALRVFSGDIHVPQTMGNVTYVGSPYHVHFGDAFKPRAVVLEKDGKAIDLHYQSPRRVTIDVPGLTALRSVELNENDQVKLRIHLSEAEKHEWRAIRDEARTICDSARVQLCGLELIVEKRRARQTPNTMYGQRQSLSPAEAVTRFVDRDDLGGSLLAIGLECLDEH